MSDVHPTVVAYDEVIGIRRVDPHRVIVNVRRLSDCAIGLTTILRYEQRNTELIETVGILWIDANLCHVPRELEVRALFCPAGAVIV